MHPVAYILTLTGGIVGAAQAESGTSDVEKITACYESKDWDCAFDGTVALFDAEDRIASCLADDHHGCGYETYFLYVVGIGAAGSADASARRDIADRAIKVLRPMSEGTIDTEGEVYFSALRYDACKVMRDTVCMEESAIMIRRAFSHGDNDIEQEDLLSEMFEETGVKYPIDLHKLKTEFTQMEMQP